MANVEVLYEGVLSMCRNPSKSSRDWTQRLFVLKLHKDTNTAMLEYYKDKKKRWQKQDTIGVVPLFPSFKLSLAHECSYKFPLKLIASGQTYFISAADFASMNAWHHHIQLSQILGNSTKSCFEYEVNVKQSESTNLMQAQNTCLLALTAGSEIICATFPRRQVLGVWPYDCLRGYWCKDRVFGFEAGRRSPRGEGIYEFFTDNNENIYRNLEKAIAKVKEGTAKVKEGDTRPPLPNRHSITPPVSTSSSDEEQPPLRPTKPHPIKKAGSVRAPLPTPDPSSGLRRVKTHTGVKRWLNDTYDPESPSNPRRSLSPVSSEDPYSHTVHVIHASPEPPPTQTYQRLHSGLDNTRPGLVETARPSSQGFSTLAEEDMPTYDVAFPVTSGHVRALPLDNEYATLDRSNPATVVQQQIPLQTQEVARVPMVATGLVPAPRLQDDIQIQDDELTDNPLYNSQDNLLKAIGKLTGAIATPPLPHRNIDTLPEFTELISPCYEQHHLSREASPKVTAQDHRGLNGEDTTDSAEMKGSGETSNEEKKPTKPYSKVKKKSPVAPPETEDKPADEGSGGDSPPPIPVRLYSMDSSNSDPPNNDN